MMEKVVSLCKRRGFVFPGSEIYGGLANSYDYGPLGIELKNNIKNLWWGKFVHQRDDIVGLDSTLLMNPKVWGASGHLKNFSDFLVECKNCHERLRHDQLVDDKNCPSCGKKDQWTTPKQFNLMFKTFMGPAEEKSNEVYFRPETAQGMFVDFKNILATGRRKLPFGIAQIGRALRNEITPSNFIFRTREFEMMEIEYFIPAPKKDEDWQKYFDEWQKEIRSWVKDVGIDEKKVFESEIPESERAHYSKQTIDFDFEFPFGRKELYGLAYRTDFDLKNHEKYSGENLKYKDPEKGEEFWPHVIEPSFGVDRTLLAALLCAYHEEKDRIILKLHHKIAPYKVAVFPLLANKPKLAETARKIYDDLRKVFYTAWDDRGNIGKRYYSQDEIGTPYCVTVDFETLEDKAVTVRDRDTMKQERVKVEELVEWLKKRLEI